MYSNRRAELICPGNVIVFSPTCSFLTRRVMMMIAVVILISMWPPVDGASLVQFKQQPRPGLCGGGGTHTAQTVIDETLVRDGGNGVVLVDTASFSSSLKTCLVNALKTALITAVVENVHCVTPIVKDPILVMNNLQGMGGCSIQVVIRNPCEKAEVMNDANGIEAVLITVLVKDTSLDLFELVVAPNTMACSARAGYACCQTETGKEIPVMVQIRVTNVETTSVHVVIFAENTALVLGGPETYVLFDALRVETDNGENVPLSTHYGILGGMKIVPVTSMLGEYIPPSQAVDTLDSTLIVWHLFGGAIFALRNSYMFKRVVVPEFTSEAGHSTGALDLRVSLSLSDGSVFGMEGLEMESRAVCETCSDKWRHVSCLLVSTPAEITVTGGSMWLMKKINCRVDTNSKSAGFLMQNARIDIDDGSLFLFHTLHVMASRESSLSRLWMSTHTVFDLSKLYITLGSQLKFMNCTLAETADAPSPGGRYLIVFGTDFKLSNGGQFIVSLCGLDVVDRAAVYNFFIAWNTGRTVWLEDTPPVSTSSNAFIIRCNNMENGRTLAVTLTSAASDIYIGPARKIVEQLQLVDSSPADVCLAMPPSLSPSLSASTEYYCDATIDCFGPTTTSTDTSESTCTCLCSGSGVQTDQHSEGAGCLPAQGGWRNLFSPLPGIVPADSQRTDSRSISGSGTHAFTLMSSSVSLTDILSSPSVTQMTGSVTLLKSQSIVLTESAAEPPSESVTQPMTNSGSQSQTLLLTVSLTQSIQLTASFPITDSQVTTLTMATSTTKTMTIGISQSLAESITNSIGATKSDDTASMTIRSFTISQSFVASRTHSLEITTSVTESDSNTMSTTFPLTLSHTGSSTNTITDTKVNSLSHSLIVTPTIKISITDTLYSNSVSLFAESPTATQTITLTKSGGSQTVTPSELSRSPTMTATLVSPHFTSSITETVSVSNTFGSRTFGTGSPSRTHSVTATPSRALTASGTYNSVTSSASTSVTRTVSVSADSVTPSVSSSWNTCRDLVFDWNDPCLLLQYIQMFGRRFTFGAAVSTAGGESNRRCETEDVLHSDFLSTSPVDVEVGFTHDLAIEEEGPNSTARLMIYDTAVKMRSAMKLVDETSTNRVELSDAHNRSVHFQIVYTGPKVLRSTRGEITLEFPRRTLFRCALQVVKRRNRGTGKTAEEEEDSGILNVDDDDGTDIDMDVGTYYRLTIPVKLPDLPISAEVVRGVQRAVVATSVVSASIGSPGVPLHQSQLQSLFVLVECGNSLDDPVDAISSPTQYGYGPDKGYYYRGAIIGNLVVFIGSLGVLLVFMSMYLALTWHQDQQEILPTTIVTQGETMSRVRERVLRTCGKFYFPGILVVPVSLGFQGTVMVSFTIFWHADRDEDNVLGLFGVLSSISVIVVITAVTTVYRRVKLSTRTEEEKEEDSSKSSSDASSGFSKLVDYVFSSAEHWAPLSQRLKVWKKCFFFLLADYRYPWFLALEFLVSFAMGVCEGLQLSKRSHCIASIAVVCSLFLILLVMVIRFNVSFSRFNNAFIIVMYSCGFIASACLLVAQFVPLKELDATTQVVTFVGMILGMLKFISDAVSLVFVLYSRRRALTDNLRALSTLLMMQKGGEGGHDNDARALEEGGALSLPQHSSSTVDVADASLANGGRKGRRTKKRKTLSKAEQLQFHEELCRGALSSPPPPLPAKTQSSTVQPPPLHVQTGGGNNFSSTPRQRSIPSYANSSIVTDEERKKCFFPGTEHLVSRRYYNFAQHDEEDYNQATSSAPQLPEDPATIARAMAATERAAAAAVAAAEAAEAAEAEEALIDYLTLADTLDGWISPAKRRRMRRRGEIV